MTARSYTRNYTNLTDAIWFRKGPQEYASLTCGRLSSTMVKSRMPQQWQPVSMQLPSVHAITPLTEHLPPSGVLAAVKK